MSGGIVNFSHVLDVFEGTADKWSMWHLLGAPLSRYLRGKCSDAAELYSGDSKVDEDYVPSIGERICVVEIPRDPGSIILIIAVLGAGYVAQRITAAANPLKKAKVQGFGQGDGQFGGIQSISTGGVPLPICYGHVRHGGNIVDSFESEFLGSRIIAPEEFQPSAFRFAGAGFDLPDTGDYFEHVAIPNDEELNRTRSTLNSRVILCAGPIQEIISSSIKIDNREISQFPGIDVYSRLGRPHQRSIDGFNQLTQTVVHNLPVVNATPALVSTTQPIDELGIVLAFTRGMYRVNSDGFKRNNPVSVSVDARLSGTTAYVSVGTFVVKDYAPNPVEYRIKVGPFARADYDFKISRVSADDVDPTKHFSSFDVAFVNEIVHEERNHPGVAQLAFRSIPGDQISAVHPTNYTAEIKGFNDIRTYTSETEFTVGWTDNPAWCCGHFLTSKLNGIGTVFSWDDIDIVSFIEWAAHADQPVQDGRGNVEKLATFNRIYDQTTSAFEILQDFASGSGVALQYGGSKFSIIVDKPRPRSHVFSEANIIGGKLRKLYFPISELPTRVTNNFKNLELDYENDSVMQEDPNIAPGLHQSGSSIEMLHVTRPGQAAREALRVVLTNTFIQDMVEFEVGVQGSGLRIGERIGISSVGIGIGLGSGLLTHVTADKRTMHLDDDVAFEAAKDYRITIQHAYDGAIDYKSLENPGDTTTNIVTAENDTWTRELRAGDQYAIGESAIEIVDYRVDSTSMSGFHGKFSMKVQAGKYDERVYDLTPTSNELESPGTIPNRDSVPGPVLNLEVSYQPAEAWSEVGRRPVRTIEVTWDPPEAFAVDHYVVIYRTSGTTTGSWDIAQITQGTYVEITNGLDLGEKYRVAVIAVSPGGLQLPISGIDTTHEVEVF